MGLFRFSAEVFEARRASFPERNDLRFVRAGGEGSREEEDGPQGAQNDRRCVIEKRKQIMKLVTSFPTEIRILPCGWSCLFGVGDEVTSL
jgi:hypothetical protein